jgi:hypothetical protein
MPVPGPGSGKPDAALDTQSGTVLLASRSKRERQHQGVPEDRFEIEQIPVKRVPGFALIPVDLVITE